MKPINRSDAPVTAQQRAFLSFLWIFVLLNVLVRDIHQFFAQGFLEQLGGAPTSEAFLLAAGVLMQVPLLMVLLPHLLPDRALRATNTLAASLILLVTVAQVILGQPDADDLLFAAVEVAALITILRGTRPRIISSPAPQPSGIKAFVVPAVAALPCLALLSLMAAPPLEAQERGDFEIGLGFAALELDAKLGGDTGLGFDGRIGYLVTNRFQLELQHHSASAILDGSFRATTLNGLYYFGTGRRIFSPYGLLGIGQAEVRLDDVLGLSVSGDATDDTVAFRAAFGARLALGGSDRTSMRIEVTALREEAFGEAAIHAGISSTFLWRLGNRGR